MSDMATVVRIPTISCIHIHTFRSQSPRTFARIRVGPRSWAPIRASAASSERGEIVLEQKPKKDDKKKLQKGIAEFYDESSGLWENIWGDHMHHGFYDSDSTVSLSDHRLAQIRMIQESLRFASVSGIFIFYKPTHASRVASTVFVTCSQNGYTVMYD